MKTFRKLVRLLCVLIYFLDIYNKLESEKNIKAVRI